MSLRGALARLLCVAGLLGVAACAPVQIKTNHGLLAAQSAREQALAGQDHWALQGRLGVSDGHDGGSGNLTWTQAGEQYDFTLRAPVTGRSFHLSGDAHSATLDGLDQGPMHGADAADLMARAFGWQVPLQQLRAWVRGLRAPDGNAQMTFAENHLPLQLQQDGWTIDYRDWFEDLRPPMPRKVFARRGDYSVKLSIHHWTLH
ncbi:MAG: lipoprotein insertase outer membrane protein LolB [Xanthomonadales bacterium]|nr:lipoprotein insertase outer membrane protein LolB [Xanthomonadales bacterium]